MRNTRTYLAFDLGASSGRAVVGRFDGTRLEMEEIHRFANGPTPVRGHLYWNVLGIFESIRTGLAKCAAAGHAPHAIGIDTWGVDFGLLSPHRELLGQPYHYRDAHTRGMMAEAFKRVPRAEIYARTGIQFMELNTLYQLLALAQESPALLDAADVLLFIPDLLNHWLTGETKSEYSIASTSQLLAADGSWARDLIEKLGLPARIMPPIVASGTVLGPLLPDIAAACGWSDALVVAPGCHDTASAVAAVPAQGASWAYISSGTWSLVGVERQQPLCNEAACAANFTNEGGVAGTIRFLKNVAGLWLVQECRRIWAERGEELSFAQLEALARSSPPRRGCIDPDLSVFADPGDMPRRIQDACAQSGQPVPETKAAIVRCALESLALKYRLNLETLERLTGETLSVVHIVGGGAHNELLCQLTADICGKLVVAGPAEATAAGNLMVQALACGHVDTLADVRAVITRSSALRHYEPQGTADWEETYARFRTMCARATGQT